MDKIIHVQNQIKFFLVFLIVVSIISDMFKNCFKTIFKLMFISNFIDCVFFIDFVYGCFVFYVIYILTLFNNLLSSY